LHKANKVVRTNPGASLLDLGDGVACLEFHTKMNVIGSDQLGMLRDSLEEVRKNFSWVGDWKSRAALLCRSQFIDAHDSDSK
jgi:hypothetical protein